MRLTHLTRTGAVFGAALSMGLSAESYTYKDWSSQTIQASPELGELCVASTTKTYNGQQWRLSFAVSSAPNPHSFIFVTAPSETSIDEVVLRSSGSGQSFELPELQSPAAEWDGNVYWNMPVSLSTLYWRLRADSAAKVSFTDATGASRYFYFSLRGSLKNFDHIRKSCGQSSALDTVFFNGLWNADVLEDAAVEWTTEALWEQQLLAQDAYVEIQAIEKELAELRSEYASVLAEQREAVAREGRLSRDLENSIESKEQAEIDLVNSEAMLEQKGEELAEAEARLQPLQDRLAAAEDAFRPVREESRPYFQAVDLAQANVNSARSRVSTYEQQVSSASYRINQLENRRDTLARQISAQRSRVEDLERRLRDAEWDYRRYNPSAELSRLRQTDSELRNIRAAIHQTDRDINSTQSSLQNARQRLRNAEARLANCRANNTGRGKCTQQREAVQNARSRVRALENRLSNLRSRLNNLQAAYQHRDRELVDYVNRRQRQLAYRVSDLRSRLRSAESDLNRLVYERNSVVRSLESARSELSTARWNLSKAQSDLSTAQSELSAAQSRLSSFKSRTGYASLEGEYQSALRDVNLVRAEVSEIRRAQERLLNRMTSLRSTIQKLEVKISRLMSEASENSAELEEIEERLVPYRLELAELTEALDLEQSAFATAASLHKTIQSRLIGGSMPQMAPMGLMSLPAPSSDKAEPFWDWL